MNGPRRVYVIVGLVILAALAIVLFDGCSLTKGRIKGAGVTVQGQKDANGVSLASGKSGEVLPLPEGSKLVITKTEAVRAIPATDTTPAVAPQPAKEVTEVVLSRDTEWRRDKEEVAANTGVIDQTVAVKRIQAAENRYLLFASLGVGALGLVFFYIKYPTPALMCGAASLLLLALWKLSDLPSWMWGVALALVVGAVLLWRGHARGESDGVKAALAGDIEPKTPPVVKSS